MLDKIFLGLSKCFQDPTPTDAGVSEQLRALELVTGLSTATIAAKSYELFKTIMESEVAQGDKMEAARLALDAAYRPGLTPVPPVGDPKHVLNFLRYHLDPRVKREDCIQVISSAMRAIDAASNDPTSRSGDWRTEDAGELLTGFQREIERVKELEGATAVVTLEEAYGRLSAVIDDMNKVCDEFFGIWTGFNSFSLSSCIRQLRLSRYQSMYGTNDDGRQFLHPPLTVRRVFCIFPSTSLGKQNCFIPYTVVTTYCIWCLASLPLYGS